MGLTARFRPLAALQHRNYRLFLSGQAVSNIGTWMQNVAQAWLVLELTQSAFLLGLLGAAQFSPILLFSLLSGAIADRFPKRKLVIATQVGLMLSAAVLAVLVSLDVVRYWHVLVLAFLSGTATALDIPARQSLIIELTGKQDLMNGIALNASVFHGARVIGPALAGVAIARFGVGLCFWMNAASFLAVIAGLLLIRLDETAVPVKDKRVWPDIVEGLRYIRATPSVLKLLLIVMGITVFALNFNVLIPVYARDILGFDAAGFGFLLSAQGIGAVTGALCLASVSHAGPRLGLIVVGVLGLCLSQLGLLPIQNPTTSAVMLAIAGWSMIVFNATTNSTLQMTVPDRLRGRVMSVYSLVLIGTSPFGNLMSGAVARWWGADNAFGFGAVLGLLFLGVFLLGGKGQAREKDRAAAG